MPLTISKPDPTTAFAKMSAAQISSEENVKSMLDAICTFVSVTGSTIGEFADAISDANDSFGMGLWKSDISRYLRGHADVAELRSQPTPQWFQADAVESVIALVNKKYARAM